MPARAKRGGAVARILAAMAAIESPSSVLAMVTGPKDQSTGIWGAKTSAVQMRPGTSRMGSMTKPEWRYWRRNTGEVLADSATLASPSLWRYIAANIAGSLGEWVPTGPALFYCPPV